MIDLETRAVSLLTGAPQRRLRWLIALRNKVARTTAEMVCFFGTVAEAPAELDRQLVILEEAILAAVPDHALTVELAAEWVVADAGLIHVRDHPTFDCQVCRTGCYDIDAAIRRLTADT